MAIENTLFIEDFPIETPIPSGFLIPTFDYPRVSSMIPGVGRRVGSLQFTQMDPL